MQKFSFIIVAIILSGCAKTFMPLPGAVMPERLVGSAPLEAYGEYPKNYQKILKDYLQRKLHKPNSAQIEFVNSPDKIGIHHLRDDVYGYRVCLSINEENVRGQSTGFKNHFFLIKNSSVVLHLFDSGMLKIPFELCVTLSEQRRIYLDDIEDQPAAPATIEEMDDPSLQKPSKIRRQRESLDKDIYISCQIDNKEFTYVFNQAVSSLEESVDIKTVPFEKVEFSKTHILGRLQDKEILINRVSGTVFLTINGVEKKGMCKLLEKKKF